MPRIITEEINDSFTTAHAHAPTHASFAERRLADMLHARNQLRIDDEVAAIVRTWQEPQSRR